jgi:sugar/nucleoside kinase (ribokinase family)
MVWDTIYRHDTGNDPVEEWGGIAFALAALEAHLPAHWQIVPLVKVGRDLAGQANRFLEDLTHRSTAHRFVEVAEPNNRVTLVYEGSVRTTERMRGGVPPWTWSELGPLLRDIDALYLNFISGFEASLDTVQQLRRGFEGPIYADLHSLLLGVLGDGTRTPQPLPSVADWFACFDVIQMNEQEMGLIGPNPLAVAAQAMAQGVRLLIVTLEAQGAVYVTTPGFRFEGCVGPDQEAGPLRTARIPTDPTDPLDPTGCGDVFGGTMVARLLAGHGVEDAVRAANRAAAKTALYRGATDLQHHLRGEIVRG